MNPIRSIRLLHLNVVSWTLVLVGVIALSIGLMVEGGEIWQLTGLMLLLAGVVKVSIIFLWSRVLGLETERHQPIPPT